MSSRYGDNEEDEIGLDTSTECRWHPSVNCYADEEKVEGTTKADMMWRMEERRTTGRRRQETEGGGKDYQMRR